MKELENVLKANIREQAGLKQLIKKELAQNEYKIAHFHSKALRRIEENIRILRNIEDKFAGDINFLLLQIKFAEQNLQNLFYPEYREYTLRQLELWHQKLAALEKQQLEYTEEPTVLPELLESIINKQIRGLKITPLKTSGLSLEISRKQHEITLKIPALNHLIKKSIIDQTKLKQFRAKGFSLSPDGKFLFQTINCQNNHPEIYTKLQITIAKIIFEIFPAREFYGESHIEIRD